MWQAIVNDTSPADCHRNDRDEIDKESLPAQNLVYDKYGSHVACWSCHQQYEGSAWGETFQHQGDGDGNTARCADIHRNGDAEYQQHAHQGIALEDGEETVWYEDGDKTGNDKTYDEPLANVLHHFHIAESQCLL